MRAYMTVAIVGSAQNNPTSTAFSVTRFAMPLAQSLNNPCMTPVRMGDRVYVTDRSRAGTLAMARRRATGDARAGARAIARDRGCAVNPTYTLGCVGVS